MAIAYEVFGAWQCTYCAVAFCVLVGGRKKGRVETHGFCCVARHCLCVDQGGSQACAELVVVHTDMDGF